jgi:hypothetical protein
VTADEHELHPAGDQRRQEPGPIAIELDLHRSAASVTVPRRIFALRGRGRRRRTDRSPRPPGSCARCGRPGRSTPTVSPGSALSASSPSCKRCLVLDQTRIGSRHSCASSDTRAPWGRS